jgi:hypothetical protein
VALNTNLSAWYPYIEPHVKGCPIPAIRQALRDAIVEFCEESQYWRQLLPAINVDADDETYLLTEFAPPAGTLIAEVITAYYNGQKMTAHGPNWLDRNYPGWIAAEASAPQNYYLPDPTQIRLVPIPTEALTAGLQIYVALKPTDTGLLVEDYLYQDWREAIAAGALGRLLESPTAPWREPNRAVKLREFFMEKMGEAYNRAEYGNTNDARRAETDGSYTAMPAGDFGGW